MAQRSRQTGTLKALWKAYQERNKKYEQMNDKQRELWDQESAAIAAHNRALFEKARRVDA
jgi:cytochrome c553